MQHINRVTGFIEISADIRQSKKAHSPVQERVLNHHIQEYGQPISYRLLKINESCYEFIPNHDSSPNLKSENKIYTYVIIIGKNSEPELRIAHGGHYYLASKSEKVYAAGDIEIENQNIVLINNQSGAFNTSHVIKNMKNECAIEQFQHDYMQSQKAVMEKVNLPFEKFQPYEIEKPKAEEIKPTKSCYDQMFSLFSVKNVAIATVTVASSVAVISQLL